MIGKSILIVVFSAALALGTSAARAMDSGSSGDADSSSAPPGDYELGVKAVRAGNYAAALPLLEKVVGKNAGNADAWNFIGYSQRRAKHNYQDRFADFCASVSSTRLRSVMSVPIPPTPTISPAVFRTGNLID